jgi:hypothetical protein
LQQALVPGNSGVGNRPTHESNPADYSDFGLRGLLDRKRGCGGNRRAKKKPKRSPRGIALSAHVAGWSDPLVDAPASTAP